MLHDSGTGGQMNRSSVEYTNSATGKTWLQPMINHFKRVA